MDPVVPRPISALHSSYTFHSPISDWTRSTYRLDDGYNDGDTNVSARSEPPEDGPNESKDAQTTDRTESDKGEGKAKQRWIMGIDEAGRGPVLGKYLFRACYS